MKLKPNEIVIDDANIFINDKFNRQVEIEPLTHLVMNVEDPLVFELNACVSNNCYPDLEEYYGFMRSALLLFDAVINDPINNPVDEFVSNLLIKLENHHYG
jgi:hypothetical protein